MVRSWATAAAIIVLLTLFRSLTLCVVAMVGLASFLQSSPIGAWIRAIRRG
jgi:hypothetical protein